MVAMLENWSLDDVNEYTVWALMILIKLVCKFGGDWLSLYCSRL